MTKRLALAAKVIGLEPYGILRRENTVVTSLSVAFLFPDVADVMDRIERRVLKGKPVDVMRLKETYANDCNIVAVAGAIIAQVAITALALQDLDKAHWTARCAFVVSLVTGCLSVFFACLVQNTLSRLFDPEEVKDWLSKPSNASKRHELHVLIAELKAKKQDINRARNLKDFLDENRWSTASLNAALILMTPSKLLKSSVAAFLVGLGIYLGYIARRDLVPDGYAVLAFYLIHTGGGLLLYYVPKTMKLLETVPRRRLHAAMDWADEPDAFANGGNGAHLPTVTLPDP